MDVGLYLFWMLWATLAYTDDDGELGYRMPISDVLSEENGVETACPWPFDPILPHMMSAPLGQYHCPYCGWFECRCDQAAGKVGDEKHPPVPDKKG